MPAVRKRKDAGLKPGRYKAGRWRRRPHRIGINAVVATSKFGAKTERARHAVPLHKQDPPLKFKGGAPASHPESAGQAPPVQIVEWRTPPSSRKTEPGDCNIVVTIVVEWLLGGLSTYKTA